MMSGKDSDQRVNPAGTSVKEYQRKTTLAFSFSCIHEYDSQKYIIYMQIPLCITAVMEQALTQIKKIFFLAT